MKKTAILFCSMICMFQVFAQEKEAPSFRWTFQVGGGAYAALNSVYMNHVTDHLQPFKKEVSPYFQVGSAYFFSKHWGAEFSVQLLYSNNRDQQAVNFINSVYDKYNASYYMETTSAIPDGSDQNITTGGVGIVYRHQYKKWSFMPKLLLGVTGSYGKWGKTLLKQKNTNNLTQIKYDPDQNSYNTFALIPAVTVAYRVSKRINLNFDVTYNYTNSETAINETETDLNTNTVKTTLHKYNEPLHAISVGAGLSFIFRQ